MQWITRRNCIKMWKHFDIFINGENLTDQRQTRWGCFKDIYASLDGFVLT
jgi:outer membrane receptor for ferrienterochelin and colicins